MAHVRPIQPNVTTHTDASDAIRRAALKAWHDPEAEKHAAWAHLHEIGMVSAEEPGPTAAQLKLLPRKDDL